ncbi:MAG: permease prefix domain 1-containing protein [Candidatus Eiseniibacteriota bacterium]
MTPRSIERYLSDLAREVRRRGVHDRRLLEEVREHLADAVAAGRDGGLSEEEAIAAALDRFGPAIALAEQHARDRNRGLDLGVLIAGAVMGLTIAYIDSRPNWDDTGVTAFALLASAGLLGFIAPRRPWLWGTAVGIWTMGAAVAGAPHSGFAAMAFILILAFPLLGAYGGAMARRFLAGVIPG